MTDGMTRRHTLTAAAALGAGLPLLGACADTSAGGGGSTGSEPTTKAGETLGPASEVPVGGGRIYADQKVVVTQPATGDFKGFSAVCTHQGCLVSTVADGTIDCTCHGSKFSVQDGSVTTGPANAPLPPVSVKVAGGTITTA